jgi:ubiquinol-cytochrome c reductase cytochrome b subunit
MALHEVLNNPDGVEIKDKRIEHRASDRGIPFHPYYTVKDSWRGRVPRVFSIVSFSA